MLGPGGVDDLQARITGADARSARELARCFCRSPLPLEATHRQQ